MTFNQTTIRSILTNVKDLVLSPQWSFQAVDWVERDVKYKYEINVFGVDNEGRSVSCCIDGFCPYFYFKVPDDTSYIEMIDQLREEVQRLYPTRAFLLDTTTKFTDSFDFKDIYGFSNHKKIHAVKVSMDSRSWYYSVVKCCRNLNWTLYGTNFSNIMKLVTDRNWLFCGWFRVKDVSIESFGTRAQISFRLNASSLTCFDNNAIAPWLQASMDIEAYSPEGFPDPKIHDNCVTQIATVFKRYGAKDYALKTIYVLGKACDSAGEDVIVRCFATEKELLLGWANLMASVDPDIIYTYNGDKFDYSFLFTRMSRSPVLYEQFVKLLSRYKDQPAKLIEKAFTSAAYGSSKYERPMYHGRVNFDLLIYVQRQYQLESYSLNNVSESFLKDKKLDLSPKEMMRLFEAGDATSLARIATYCVQDTLLPQRLVEKLLVVEALVEMSNITHIPFAYNIERGQQIKVFSQIVRFAAPLGYLVPDLSKSEDVDDMSFKGAVVLVAKAGFYDCVSTLDFASLYPSIIMAHRLCYSSLVMDDEKYGNLPGVKYNVFEWEEEENVESGMCEAITKAKGLQCQKPAKYGPFCGTHKGQGSGVAKKLMKKVKYQAKYADHKETVLPMLLDTLYTRRKDVRKIMRSEKDPFVYNLLDKRQLAIKVSMNSCYGFLAAHMLKAKSIAATVTAVGRSMIIASKEFTEVTFPTILPSLTTQSYALEVVYGDTDSIFIQFTDKSATPLQGAALIKDVMLCSEECSKRITEMFNKPPIKLEFEKVYHPLILYKKKRYIGALFTSPDKADKIDKKGVVSKRRDNCRLIRLIYNDMTSVLMEKSLGGLTEAFDLLRSYCDRLVSGDIPLKDLTISKSIAGQYKKPEQMAHVMLAQSLEARGFEERFASGDRIPYVFVLTQESRSVRVDLRKSVGIVEHPKIVQDNNLQLDVAFYLRKQIEKPVLSFFRDIAGEEVVAFFQSLYRQLHEQGVPGVDRCKVVLAADDDIEDVEYVNE